MKWIRNLLKFLRREVTVSVSGPNVEDSVKAAHDRIAKQVKRADEVKTIADFHEKRAETVTETKRREDLMAEIYRCATARHTGAMFSLQTDLSSFLPKPKDSYGYSSGLDLWIGDVPWLESLGYKVNRTIHVLHIRESTRGTNLWVNVDWSEAKHQDAILKEYGFEVIIEET